MTLQTRPYTGPGDDTLPDAVKALPDGAKKIWAGAFNGAWDSWDSSKTDLDQEAYAFAVAWGAVKNVYKQVNGEWQKRDRIAVGDGHLSKVWRDAGGIARWKSTCSDDGVDLYGTRMTIDFQKDMCARANAGIAAGGPLPVWLGIAHYRRFSQIGTVDRLYVDGRRLKAEGRWLTDAPDELTRNLAAAAFEKALDEAKVLPAHRAIRTSIAFYPEAFEIEDCGIIAYTRGGLEHIALTTRPGNSRVDFGLGDEEDTMPGKRSKTGRRELRREDAASIVGDELAERLYATDASLGGERTEQVDGLIYRAEGDGPLEVSPDNGTTWEEVDPTNMRHRAQGLWTLERLADQEALGAAQAQLRTDVEAGTVPKPTLAEAIAMFEGAHDVGIALIRATGLPDFRAALGTLVADPQALEAAPAPAPDPAPAPAPDERAGRRLRGEMLEQLNGAITSLQSLANWAKANLPEDQPETKSSERVLVEPGVDFRAAYAARFHGEIAPDQSLMAAMTNEALMETAYHAGWTLMDIIAANVEAAPEDLPLADRLVNVQKALTEYGQILNQVLATAAEARSAAGGDDPAAGGAAVKPDGAAEGAVNPPPGEADTTALATVRGILDAIGEMAGRGDATADEAQNLIDLLPAALAGVVQAPSEDVAALIAEAQAPLMREIEELRQLIEQGAPATRGDDGLPPAGPPPPRRYGLPSPRRGHLPSLLDEGAARMTTPPRGMTIREFALRGAHRAGQFDPHQ